MSSLLLVLLLLVMGSLMLQGLGREHQRQLSQLNSEVQALRDGALADSLLQWGRMQNWQAGNAQAWREAQALAGRVCLRQFTDSSVLLIAISGQQQRWWGGGVDHQSVQFNPHGWSDFCPRKQVAQCAP